ncbi:hypothetical protein ABW21_db0203265 [Orbilia brochopaga]|nr:hypothetical protein ABW21_db0203265 [Drechslerella brochopaga]
MTHATRSDDARHSESTPPSAGLAQSYYQTGDLPTSPLPTYSDSSNTGYKTETMSYSKPADESKSTESPSTALLSQADKDPESPPQSRSCKSKSRLTHKNSYVRGKQYLSILRIYISPATIVVALVSSITIAIAFYAIYSPAKTSYSDPTNRPNSRVYAFPQTLDTLPETIMFAAGIFATIFNTALLFIPICRSERRFYHRRYSRSELLELFCHLVVIAAGAAGLYFAFTMKPDLDKSLWGFTCSRSAKSADSKDGKNPNKEPVLFPDIRYTNACNDLNIGVYALVVAVALSFMNFITYMVNLCMKRRQGEYIEDDDSVYLDALDCCCNCCSAVADCFLWFQCCFAICNICS